MIVTYWCHFLSIIYRFYLQQKVKQEEPLQIFKTKKCQSNESMIFFEKNSIENEIILFWYCIYVQELIFFCVSLCHMRIMNVLLWNLYFFLCKKQKSIFLLPALMFFSALYFGSMVRANGNKYWVLSIRFLVKEFLCFEKV